MNDLTYHNTISNDNNYTLDISAADDIIEIIIKDDKGNIVDNYSTEYSTKDELDGAIDTAIKTFDKLSAIDLDNKTILNELDDNVDDEEDKESTEDSEDIVEDKPELSGDEEIDTNEDFLLEDIDSDIIDHEVNVEDDLDDIMFDLRNVTDNINLLVDRTANSELDISIMLENVVYSLESNILDLDDILETYRHVTDTM